MAENCDGARHPIPVVNGVSTESTRKLLRTYLQWHTSKHRTTNSTAPPVDNSSAHPLDMCLRRLLKNFSNRYADNLNSLLTEMEAVNTEKPRQSYESVLSGMFDNNVNWGRIIAMIAFMVALHDRELAEGRPAQGEAYVDWTTQFVHQHPRLWPWIQEHGGWEGLINFEEVRDRTNTDEDMLWSSLTNIAKVTVGAIGVAAFCRFLTNRI